MIGRRGFLTGLAGLPLIGGGIALLGAPSAAAVPVSAELLDRYLSFLILELDEAAIERDDLRTRRINEPVPWAERLTRSTRFPDINASLCMTPASTRAAVVLSAAGIPLGRPA